MKGDENLQIDDIIHGCQLGDMDCFEELYKLYFNKAFGTAYIISGQKGLAEDIVQEAFLICYKSIKYLKEPGAFNTWFYRIVVRESWKMAKTKKSSLENFNAGITSHELIQSTLDNSVDDLCNKLLLQQSIKSLKLPLKTVLILYYYNDMSIKEISKVLGCFEGTVKSRLFKARKILQNELSPYYDSFVKPLDLKRMEA